MTGIDGASEHYAVVGVNGLDRLRLRDGGIDAVASQLLADCRCDVERGAVFRRGGYKDAHGCLLGRAIYIDTEPTRRALITSSVPAAASRQQGRRHVASGPNVTTEMGAVRVPRRAPNASQATMVSTGGCKPQAEGAPC